MLLSLNRTVRVEKGGSASLPCPVLNGDSAGVKRRWTKDGELVRWVSQD